MPHDSPPEERQTSGKHEAVSPRAQGMEPDVSGAGAEAAGTAPAAADGEPAAPRGGTRQPRSWSGWIAAALVVLLVGWMASGMLAEEEEPAPPPARAEAVEPVAVEAMRSAAKVVTRTLTIEGEVTPDLSTPVRSEAGGTVEELVAERGAVVTAGQELVRIAPAERVAELAEARAAVRRAERDFDSITQLAERGFATRAREEEVRSTLAAAQARLATVQESLDDTVVRAPVAGILAELEVDRGEFVQPGEEIARIIDTDPLVVDVRVPQGNVSEIAAGQSATVEFVTGQSREGRVRFIAPVASSATRTFEIEVAVPNPDGAIPAGISAEVALPVAEVEAHFVSPAILALGDDGVLGVKTVDEDDRVAFFPVDLVRAETDGIWVSGLPAEATIITIGQGFVSAGEPVAATIDEENAEDADPAPPAEDSTASNVVEALDRTASAATPPASDTGAADADAIAAEPAAARSPASPTEPAGGQTDGPGAERMAARPPAPSMAETVSGADETAGAPAEAQGEQGEAPPQSRNDTAEERDPGRAADQGADRDLSEDFDTITRVQVALQQRGYDVGPVDGLYGPDTAGAIQSYEDDAGLPLTGDVTVDLLRSLELSQS